MRLDTISKMPGGADARQSCFFQRLHPVPLLPPSPLASRICSRPQLDSWTHVFSGFSVVVPQGGVRLLPAAINLLFGAV
jgi:hypothetical protein